MDMDWEDLKRGYIAAVLHELTTEHGVTEADANKLIEAYRLRERLDIEPVGHPGCGAGYAQGRPI